MKNSFLRISPEPLDLTSEPSPQAKHKKIRKIINGNGIA